LELLSNVIPDGLLRLALVAAPPSPAKAPVHGVVGQFPANVLIEPEALTSRIRSLMESEM
jgi:hypothetical protein